MGGDAPTLPMPTLDDFGKHPLSTLTELADPLHVDPVGRHLHTDLSQNLNDLHSPAAGNAGYGPSAGPTPPDPNAPAQPTTAPPPSREAATDTAFDSERDDEQRRRSASRTLLTGGRGLLDRPTTASTVLLGS